MTGFIIGLFVGAILGYFTCALMVMSKIADAERLLREAQYLLAEVKKAQRS